jgi:hypothetical protein
LAGFAGAGPSVCLAAEAVGGDRVVLQRFFGLDRFAEQLQVADGGDPELGAEELLGVPVDLAGVVAGEVEELLERGTADGLGAGAHARFEEDLSGAGVVVVPACCRARDHAAAHDRNTFSGLEPSSNGMSV